MNTHIFANVMRGNKLFNKILGLTALWVAAIFIVSCKKEAKPTIDLGWSEVINLENDHGFKIRVMPDKKIYLTTLFGRMYVSYNQGVSFQQQSVWGSPWSINDVAFSKESNFLVGREGLMGRESDGGSGLDWWQTLTYNSSYDFHTVSTVKDYIWISATQTGSKNSILFASDNGGASFLPIYLNSKLLYKVEFVTEYNGWLAGDGFILKSTNRGLSWKIKFQNPAVNFRDIVFQDSLNGIAVGFPSAIYRTKDGGETWNPANCPVNCTLLSATYTPSGKLWLAGHKYIKDTYKGVLLYADDVTGEFQAHPADLNALYSIAFMSDSLGFAAGEGKVYRTQRGGW